MPLKLHQFPDRNALYAACTAELRAADSAALSGGQTPIGWFDYLALHWSARPGRELELYWVDERLVPWTAAESNFGTAWRHWLHAAPGVRLHPLTEEYPAGLTLDQIWLGMGPDGHTASWFPGVSAYQSAAVAVKVPAPRTVTPAVARRTLTLATVLRAKRLELLITGEAKLTLLLDALAAPPTAACPVSLLQPAVDRLNIWYAPSDPATA